MQCFEVVVPEGGDVAGRTATGDRVQVHPGEYLVHLLRPKAGALTTALLRFVGGDPQGRDVYVSADQIRGGLECRLQEPATARLRGRRPPARTPPPAWPPAPPPPRRRP